MKTVLHIKNSSVYLRVFALILSHYACNRDTEEKRVDGESSGFVQELYIHQNLQKHRHGFPNGSPYNSGAIRPWARSRTALKVSETSIHWLHHTTHKEPKYTTILRAGVTAKVVRIPNVHFHGCATHRGRGLMSKHRARCCRPTLGLCASVGFEVSKFI